MIKANKEDRGLIVEILSASFKNNQSVNFIVKQDDSKPERIKALMEYSFDICMEFGDVFLSDEKNGCALFLYPQLKKTSFYSTWLDVKLIVKSIGISRIGKALKREGQIKKIQAVDAMAYLWFIGVQPSAQHSGIGGKLLLDIIEFAKYKSLPVYLETSTLVNLPWYEEFGFNIYHQLDLGYTLFFLHRKLDKD